METIPSRRALSERPRYPWKIFWLLLLASAVGVAALLPYLIALFQKVLSAKPLPMPLPVLMTVQLMQSAILFAGFISLGLLLAPKAGSRCRSCNGGFMAGPRRCRKIRRAHRSSLEWRWRQFSW